ncbi:TetR family transcriptional regulator [Paractinoplanes abujensis]|uniref:AcrR family transcriptional regulator n=1 Tax=Paractinoplanes abujensis TaxID=882441 RepID=A0A7W7CLI9_9ACTN|nr:TetR/AcrR family transcriptional regulator [Actinoplanes abujensis]MBB4690707.1 AcrR family transcriptional regulator [Actinoplanes abujensis]GID17880.1 TetR family transcriptional regulator [Actinoplanes abujensis]
MSSPLRQRRRTAATREILDAAREQIGVSGPAGLSLRSVARSLEMTVQALYHYFPSRDELITTLITEAYLDLAETVEDAVAAAPGFIPAATAFRAWAIGNAPMFQLIYGTPLPHYEAPDNGRTTDASRRLASVFVRELFGPYAPEQLARADVPPLSAALRDRLDDLPPPGIGTLPAPAVALFVSVWGHLHGLVTLEAFGHTAFIGPLQAELFQGAMQSLLADVRRRIPA